jgi:hypothetical protein
MRSKSYEINHEFISSHTIKKIHPMDSFLFGGIFFGAAVVGILTGLAAPVCEDVPSPNNVTSMLHINLIRQLDV